MSKSIQTSRLIPFPPARVYAAFADGPTLATWWGPDGFTNEFDVFEFRAGGEWKFTMVGPNGSRYANLSRFVELQPGKRVVIRHDCAPFFTLSVGLAESGSGTELAWEMEFDDPAVLEAVRRIVVPANEQNLDRLVRALERTAAI